jgi:ribosomal protein L24
MSNVMLWDPKAKSATRVTKKRAEGKTQRVSKKSGDTI